MSEYQPPAESELMGAAELRQHLREVARESVGTDELEEANRRWDVLLDWRDDAGE